MQASATGLPAGLLLDTSAIASGTIAIAGSPTGGASGPDQVTITLTDSFSNQTTYTIDVWVELYGVSPDRGNLLISEVLYQERGPGQFDEYVELYNAGPDPINLQGMSVAIHSRKTGGAEHGVGPYIFPQFDQSGSQSMLPSGAHAVLWMWQSAVPTSQFEVLRYVANNNQPVDIFIDAGDDLWLYDQDLRIVDYVAWNTGAPGSEIINPPAAVHGFWNGADSHLGSAMNGRSIARASIPSSMPGPTCWELTGSGDATCADAVGVTQDFDATSRVASPGQFNTP